MPCMVCSVSVTRSSMGAFARLSIWRLPGGGTANPAGRGCTVGALCRSMHLFTSTPEGSSASCVLASRMLQWYVCGGCCYCCVNIGCNNWIDGIIWGIDVLCSIVLPSCVF
jgi:hypothetical protein